MTRNCSRLVWGLLIGVSITQMGCCEKPVEATVCQLKANPPAYNHKIISVTGFVSHGFEDFSLFDPKCPSWPGIWLEYGGKLNSGTIYCCDVDAERHRAESLVLEGVSAPLLIDKHFEEFDKAVQPPFRSGNQDVVLQATLVGRFFAGRHWPVSKESRGAAMVIWAVVAF